MRSEEEEREKAIVPEIKKKSKIGHDMLGTNFLRWDLKNTRCARRLSLSRYADSPVREKSE